MYGRPATRLMVLVALAACAWCSGCASLRLPRIDPTGQRIFLPSPNFTTPVPAVGPLSCLPQPAFTEPPPLPPCTDLPARGAAPPAAAVVPLAGEAAQDRLIVSPTKMVAPVGTEVILLAGICGPDGYYVTKQPIEWSLSQDSAGNIVDLGERADGHLAAISHQHRRRFSSDFAVTRTSTAARRIDRGTPPAGDDVWLQKGQAWITVTSATQGVSYVTVLAPGAENWERRRQTATIHWVDAQWTLPAPAIVPAGDGHTLTTTVTRASSGAGARHWEVRYEIVSGIDALFEANGQKSVSVTTDAEGKASARILPRAVQPGTAQVRIQIYSPQDVAGRGENVPVGQGFTTVSWSAPALSVGAAGPASAAVGATVSYQIEVGNPGDLVAENVSVVAEVPAWMEHLNSQPPGQVSGNRVIWQFASLGPGQRQRIQLNCRARAAGDQRLSVRAESSSGLRDDAYVDTRVVRTALAVEFVDPPRTARVGEQVHYNVRVSNIGDVPVRNVVVLDQFDPGFTHAGGERSPIRKLLGEIAPGDAREIGVRFVVNTPGRLCHTLEATADGGHVASDRACLDATQPRLALQVRVAGPARRTVGEKALYEITVTNAGEGTLTGIHLINAASAALTPTEVSPNADFTSQGIAWHIDRLEPGLSEVRQVQCTCSRPDARAQNAVRVISAEGVSATDAAFTEIVAAGPADDAPQLPADGQAPRGPASGQLKVSVAKTADPIFVGDRTTYIIELKNDRDVTDRNVKVTIQLPAGLRFERFESVSAPLAVSLSADERVVDVERIAEMRPRDTRLFRLQVGGNRVGTWTMRVEAQSQRTPQPIEVVEQTTVRQN